MNDQSVDDQYDRAQLAAETHLTLCVDALHDGADDSPAIRPFCGCDTCIVREVLFAAKEELLAIVRAEA